MTRLLALVGSLAVTQAALAAPVPAGLLEKVGASEQRRAAAPACHYVETTVVEQLAKDGSVRGKETRTYDVVRRGDEVLRRELVKTVAEGEKLSALLRGHDHDKPKKKPAPSPLAPDQQKLYRFETAPAADQTRAIVTFEPLSPATEHPKGRAEVDLATGDVVSFDFQPSKNPTFVDEFHVHVDFADTPCGRQAARVTTRGSGGIAFYELRVRTVSTFEGYALQR